MKRQPHVKGVQLNPNWAELIKAIDYRDCRRVRSLLRGGTSANATDAHGTPALNCALYENLAREQPDEDIALLLLKAGAEADKKDDAKTTPIMLACKHGFKRVVKLLLEKEVSLCARTYGGVFSYGETPLSIAAGKVHREVVRMLLEAGADVNQPMRKGVTALASAAESGDISVLGDLVAAGGKATGVALFHPVSRGRLDIVAELIAAGADPNIRDRWGNTVLGIAVQAGHPEVVQAIIRVGATLDAVSGGRTPLIFAVLKGNELLVDMLLEAGAQVDARDIYRCTALMAAATKPHKGMVARLLAAGANARLKMETGVSAIKLAKDHGMLENLEILNRAIQRKGGCM